MSITFALSIPGQYAPLNLANGNACALLAVAGLAPSEYGEVGMGEVGAVVARLLRVVNVPTARIGALTTEPPAASAHRWLEGVRDDDYVARRSRDLLDLFYAAQRCRCGVTWG